MSFAVESRAHTMMPHSARNGETREGYLVLAVDALAQKDVQRILNCNRLVADIASSEEVLALFGFPQPRITRPRSLELLRDIDTHMHQHIERVVEPALQHLQQDFDSVSQEDHHNLVYDCLRALLDESNAQFSVSLSLSLSLSPHVWVSTRSFSSRVCEALGVRPQLLARWLSSLAFVE